MNDITSKTEVTGAEFRDFYKNHWPSDWYVEEMPYEAEDECGNWVLPDDAKKPLSWFGYPVFQGERTSTRKQGDVIQMHELYAEVMSGTSDTVLVTFRVNKTDLSELLLAAQKLQAEQI